MSITLPIEDRDGEPTVRLPDDILQRLDLHIGDSLYLVEAWVGDGKCLVLSQRPLIPCRVDALVAQWDRELAAELGQATPPDE